MIKGRICSGPISGPIIFSLMEDKPLLVHRKRVAVGVRCRYSSNGSDWAQLTTSSIASLPAFQTHTKILQYVTQRMVER